MKRGGGERNAMPVVEIDNTRGGCWVSRSRYSSSVITMQNRKSEAEGKSAVIEKGWEGERRGGEKQRNNGTRGWEERHVCVYIIAVNIYLSVVGDRLFSFFSSFIIFFPSLLRYRSFFPFFFFGDTLSPREIRFVSAREMLFMYTR